MSPDKVEIRQVALNINFCKVLTNFNQKWIPGFRVSRENLMEKQEALFTQKLLLQTSKFYLKLFLLQLT